ncbi:MAG: hypothetical protein IPH20_16645 [Bacteroidales bacterium]|nr:hypothetical protein [Bacteroidales bacterium]
MKLNNELQAQLAELQIQNRELLLAKKRAEEALVESEKKYAVISKTLQ